MVYTLAVWRALAGHEDRFVAGWQDLADWTLAHFPGQTKGTLVRDTVDPTRFISFGPWPDAATVRRWREDPEFVSRIAALHEHLGSFEPGLFEVVAERG